MSKKIQKEQIEGLDEALEYQNSETMPVDVGGWPAGTDFSDPKTIEEMFNGLLYPELYPSLSNPSSTFTSSVTGLREIGELISEINFNSSFNRGSISPQYESASPYRSGLPNTYKYTGTGLSNQSSTSLTDVQQITNYTVAIEAQSWTGQVAYDAGVQPKSNKGNDYDSLLAAGDTSLITRTITGVYPVFSTSVNITTMTKQVLQFHGSNIVTSLVAESGGNKQSVEIPDAGWTITQLEQYNTLSGQWDVISLALFTSTPITKNIQGNTVNYTKYMHNGALIGARQLRWS